MIVLFGVLHHIPGFKTRVDLLKKLMKKLKPEGHLIFSTWNFLDSPSLKRRIQPWSLLDLEEEKVEEDDYLLDWKKGEEALRYCHYFTDKEVKKLCRESLLKIKETFKSGQKGDKYNRYFVTGV